jgi:hypothetical protein
MPRPRKAKIEEKKLTKGQLRKLNALRKSLGDEIAEGAFAKWYARHGDTEQDDKNANVIAEVLWDMIQKKKLRISRRGYVVKRGRQRLIVEAQRRS